MFIPPEGLTEEQAAAMAPGDQRQALVNQLSRITHRPADSLSGLRDYDLIGRGAAIAFLLQMGIVNEDLGIDWSLDNYRNTLIVETAGLGYDGALQGLTDQQLVRLALEHAGDRWRLGPRLTALRDQVLRLAKKDEEDILADLPSILGLPAKDGFSISAGGGAGGEGQQGQQGADGGDGGPGWSYTDASRFATAGGDGGQGGNGGKGGKGGPGGKGGSVIVHLIAGGLQPSVNNKGGDAGLPGQGGPRGEPGAPGLGGADLEFEHGRGWVWPRKPSGKPGQRGEVGQTGDPGSRGADGAQQLSNGSLTPESLVANTRVSQLVMMWQRVRAEYVATDPAGSPATMKDLVSRVDWVATRLKAIPQSSPDFPLTAAVLPGILSTQVAARAGLDYFGFGPFDVPAGSIALYREWLKNALAALEKLEGDFTRYFEALHNETDATAAFGAAAAKAADRKKALEDYRSALKAKITHELEKIQEFEGKEGKRTKDRQVVKGKLTKFSDEVDKAFGLTPETFLNCLSQLSFTSPENAMGAGIMVASQFGTVVNEGVNHILSDSKELVKKSWVLENINQFDSPDLLADVTQVLEEASIDPSRIVLEVTEGSVMEDPEHVLHVLQQLRELGVRIALDDFGTGYSALVYLRQFPFDRLKIDRAFLHDLDVSAGNRSIVSAIVALAHSLGLEVVAEGVEEPRHVELLKNFGCDLLQGYGLARPARAEEAKAMIAAGVLTCQPSAPAPAEGGDTRERAPAAGVLE
jgi:EAL domain-containing protein (putative c-di-GMP-specific phosphodiesterase class I)